MEKAQFIGRFFHWVKTAFMQKKTTPETEKKLIHVEEKKSDAPPSGDLVQEKTKEKKKTGWHMTEKLKKKRRVEAVGEPLDGDDKIEIDHSKVVPIQSTRKVKDTPNQEP